MKELKIEQNTTEWMVARCGRITASAFDTLIPVPKRGKEKFSQGQLTYLRTVAAERLTGLYEEGFQTKAMQQGHEREPLARNAISASESLFFRESGPWEYSDFVLVSPDGIGGFNEFTLELKCPQPPNHLLYLLDIDELFKKYEYQIKGQMYCTGIHEGYFGSYNPDFPEGKQLVYSTYALTNEDIQLFEDRLGEAVEIVKGMTN